MLIRIKFYKMNKSQPNIIRLAPIYQVTLNELSIEELLKQQKTIKFATGLVIGGLTTLLIIGISLALQKTNFVSSIVIPFSLLPIVFLNLSTLKKIKKELNSRENMQ